MRADGAAADAQREAGSQGVAGAGQTAVITARIRGPQGKTEQTLAPIWSELLHLERVGRHDNFFELGGHSLLAMQAVQRASREFDVNIPLERLFSHSTLTALGEYILDEQFAQFDANELEGLVKILRTSTT